MSTKEVVTPERASWGKPLEFILSCVGYAVGLGNVWRFPYLCYKNGGGAFLFAYLVMLLLMGLPIFLMELLLGQYTGQGPDACFSRIAPIFRGLGYCTLIVIIFITIYYMVIISWTVFYFFASFTSDLGFGSCLNDYNSNGCFSALEDADCGQDETYYNKTCTKLESFCNAFDMNPLNKTFCAFENGTAVNVMKVTSRPFATLEYFNEYMLGKGDATWENYGGIRWELVACLLFSWLVAYLCVVRGVKSAGKAVYFTALFPYVVLTAFVIQGAMLEGAVDGILLYITPKWEKLLEAEVWGNAASQTFYSFGIGCGSLITLSSYSSFTNNCLKDAIIVSLANAFTAVYAGFAIFSMIGFLANQLELPVDDVVQDGPGLAFVAYPEAMFRLPLPTLWAILFFFMLFILGLGSQFAGIEAMSTLIKDRWSWLRNYQPYLVACLCFGCFLMALPMCFAGGIYMFTLMEWNTASWAILLIGFAEIVSVSWIYGCSKMLDHMDEMNIKLGWISRWFWWICWTIISPLTCLFVFAFQMIHLAPSEYEGYVFPDWADSIGILIGTTTLVPFFAMLAYTLYTRQYTIRELFKPTNEWCGRNEIDPSAPLTTSLNVSQDALANYYNVDDKPQEKF